MSLCDFQRAFAIVVKEPASWARRLARSEFAVAGLVLSDEELERLRRIVQHPGMAANHLLLRANRMMPIRGALPLTCDWLRVQLNQVLDAWLAASSDASVQYGREAERFSAWIPRFLARAGADFHPALDALRYERAVEALTELAIAGAPSPRVDLHFSYDPDVVLGGWRPHAPLLDAPLDVHLCVVDGMIALERSGRH